jgi:hypothetical protein
MEDYDIEYEYIYNTNFDSPEHKKMTNRACSEVGRNHIDANTLDFSTIKNRPIVSKIRHPSIDAWLDPSDYPLPYSNLLRNSIDLEENEDHLWEMLNTSREDKGNLNCSNTSNTKSDSQPKGGSVKDINRPSSVVSMSWNTTEKENETQDDHSWGKGKSIHSFEFLPLVQFYLHFRYSVLNRQNQ